MPLLSDIETVSLSGLNYIDALLDQGPGWNWLTPTRDVIYYTFSVASGNQPSSSIITTPTAFNASQQAAALEQMAYVSQLTGIRFAAASSPSLADIHFAAADILTSASTSGLCSWSSEFSYDNNNVVTRFKSTAYVYLDNVEWRASNANPLAGNQGYETLLHELGHALGLKHPFEGTVVLPDAQDTKANSIMSYSSTASVPSTFGPYDLAALAWIYGGDGLGGNYGIGTTGKYLLGTAAIENLRGGSGNDKLSGLAGNDVLDGGAGVDVAIFTGSRNNFKITQSTNSYTVQATTGTDGVDVLTGIERLQFSDTSLALDINGNAGVTAKILGAVFGKGPVSNTAYCGIGLRYLDSGWTYERLMTLALDAAGAISNTAVIQLLWTNLYGSAPTADQARPFITMLDNGTFTRASIAVAAAELDVNKTNIDLVGLSTTGLEFS